MMHAGIPLDDQDRLPWLRAIAFAIDQERKAGNSIVVACSALRRSYRDLLVDGHADTRIVYLKGDRDTILLRMKKRKPHFMPPKLLDSQFTTLEEPTDDEHAIVVTVRMPVGKIVDRIVEKLAVSRDKIT